MHLRTLTYLAEPSQEMVDPLFGLRDLRKGLHTILLGYLLCVGSILAVVGVVCYLIIQAGDKPLSPKAADGASTVLFAAALIFGLTMIGSAILIVRGKWMCLISAPEQCHAKWMMFLSILCVLAGPALNTSVVLIGETQEEVRVRGRDKTTALLDALKEHQPGLPTLNTRGYVKLAGQVIGLFSSVFLVLFLRAVGLCLGVTWQVRLVELYLALLALLAAGIVVLLRNPAFLLARPQLLLGLAAGWLIAGLWYLGLIVGASLAIAPLLDLQNRQ